MIYEFQQPRFTEGVLAKSLQGRSTEEFYLYGVKAAQNMIPLLEGPMIKRPGTIHVSSAGHTTSRLFPFYKGGEEAYVVEIGYDNSASDTTLVCTTAANDKTIEVTTGSTSSIFVGQHVWNAKLDATTGYPTTNLDSSSQVASITDTDTFELTNDAVLSATSQTLNFSNKPFIRIYSQDRLLNVQGTTTPYVIKSHRWIIDSNIDEIATLQVSQSGDVLFFTCPTRVPFLLSRTLEPTNAARAEDNSVWTISQYEAEDGPYQSVNADLTKSFLVTGTTIEEDVGDVAFKTATNEVVVSNHGLQTGQKLNLYVANTTNDSTGNTQIIVKDGTVDPTVTTDVSVAASGGHIQFTTVKSHGLNDGDIVQIGDNSGSLPGNISASTNYYVVSAAYKTFKVSTAEGGTPVSHSSDGSNVFFGSNSATSFGDGDPLLGSADNLSESWCSNSGKDNHFYVVYSTNATFQISDGHTNKSFDMGFRDADSAVPPTSGVQFSGKVTLKRVVHAKGTSITVKSRIKLSTGCVDATATNGGETFTDADVGRMMRLNTLADPSTRRGGIRWGWGKITAVADVATCTVKLETDLSPNPDTTNGTPEWRLGAFSGYIDYSTGAFTGLGYPKLSQIYQQRFVFATTEYEPSTVWLSRTGNFYSFSPTELGNQDTPVITGGVTTEVISDSNAISFTIDSDTLDEIQWLMDSKKLALGTSAGVYFLYGTETNLAVSPTRFTVSRETSYSASSTQPVIVSNVIIYPQRGGREIQELEFSGAEDQWLQSRISMKAYDMIAQSSVIKVDWQERPNPIIWMVMDNGQVLTLSYDRSVKFKAWSVHTLGGAYQGGIAKVVDISIIPRTDYDQVWFKVKRTINGSDVEHIEILGRFPSENIITRNELVFLDSAKIHRASEILTGTPLVKGAGQATNQSNLVVDGITTAPPADTRFLIAGDTTIYKVVSATVGEINSLSDTTPTPSGAWETSNTETNITQTSTSGSGTGARFTTVTDGSGNPTVAVTTIGTGYAINDTIVLTDQGSTSQTATITISAVTSTWTLDQNLVAVPADNAAIELRLQKLTIGHLEGQSAGLCTNGMEHVNKTVASNIVTLDHALASTAVSGLSYTAQMETLSPPTPDNQYNFNKRLLTLTALVQESLGIEIEYNETTEEMLFRSTQQNTGEPIDFFSGFKKSSLSGIGWQAHSVIIRSISPLPMQINSLSIEVETGGA